MCRGFFPVDLNFDLGIFDLKVTADIGQSGKAMHFFFHFRSIPIQFRCVRPLKGQLVLTLCQSPANANRWRILKKNENAGKLCQLYPQTVDDLVNR